jgi:hypothetical protein
MVRISSEDKITLRKNKNSYKLNLLREVKNETYPNNHLCDVHFVMLPSEGISEKF